MEGKNSPGQEKNLLGRGQSKSTAYRRRHTWLVRGLEGDQAVQVGESGREKEKGDLSSQGPHQGRP